MAPNDGAGLVLESTPRTPEEQRRAEEWEKLMQLPPKVLRAAVKRAKRAQRNAASPGAFGSYAEVNTTAKGCEARGRWRRVTPRSVVRRAVRSYVAQRAAKGAIALAALAAGVPAAKHAP